MARPRKDASALKAAKPKTKKGPLDSSASHDEETGKRVLSANGYDPDVVETVVRDIEDLQDQIDGIMQVAKDKCSPIREQIGDAKKIANEENGLPRKELNAILQERRLRTKADNVRTKLSNEQQDEFDKLKLALGMLADLPLGQSAMAH